ncbi:hypothetical protein [Aureispira anguillae]|uniref:Uncharacterized protein n=1 Tax=Aureispira anguillae TaxID=2864201 RepID=A0A916DUT2_9BACT|nr:hypothetical protein [Aureispira anguillae]BDS13641.1 hypothetical protein AsAng_0043800 [Aureispira anguillae]
MDNERKLLIDGQGSFCDIIKTALYQEDSTIFERLDFYDDKIFLEPLLFGYCGRKNPKMTNQQILFGYAELEHKPLQFKVFSNQNGVVYLPNYGYLKTEKPSTFFELNYQPERNTIVLKQGEERVVFDFLPINYLTTIPSIELSSSIDPHSEDLFYAWPNAKATLINELLSTAPIAVEPFQIALEQALALLKEHLPNEFEKYALSTRKIILFSSSELRNFATREAHGTTYLNVNENSNVTFFLEELIHQCSHIVFNAMTCNIEEFFLVNHNETIGNYLNNEDDRTLYSALHGIYTTGQIVDSFLEIIKKNPGFDPEILHELKGRIAINKNRHNIGLEQIPLTTVFTPKGQALFSHYYQKLDNNIKNNPSFFDFDMASHPVVFNYQKFKRDNPLGELKWS